MEYNFVGVLRLLLVDAAYGHTDDPVSVLADPLAFADRNKHVAPIGERIFQGGVGRAPRSVL